MTRNPSNWNAGLLRQAKALLGQARLADARRTGEQDPAVVACSVGVADAVELTDAPEQRPGSARGGWIRTASRLVGLGDESEGGDGAGPRPLRVAGCGGKDRNRRNEVVAPTVHGADHVLTLPGVTHRATGRLDPAGQRRFAHEPVAPDVVEQLLLAHDPVAVTDQVREHVEHLRLDRGGDAAITKLATLDVELAGPEPVDQCHLATSGQMTGGRHSRRPKPRHPRGSRPAAEA
jgi:hypothetical protein